MKPTGVRVHRADGTVLNAELVHNGPDHEGLDNWLIANIDYRPGDNVSIEELPPRTSISFRALMPPGTLPENVRVRFKGRRIKKKKRRR
jgi:hypothetical protein